MRHSGLERKTRDRAPPFPSPAQPGARLSRPCCQSVQERQKAQRKTNGRAPFDAGSRNTAAAKGRTSKRRIRRNRSEFRETSQRRREAGIRPPGQNARRPADIITSEGQDVKGRSALPPETLRKTPNRPLILNWKAAKSDVGSGGRGVPLPRSDGMQDSLAPGGKALSGRIPAAASEHEAENSTLGNENPSSFIKMNSDPINWWSIPQQIRTFCLIPFTEWNCFHSVKKIQGKSKSIVGHIDCVDKDIDQKFSIFWIIYISRSKMPKPVFEVFFRHIWVFQRFFGDGEFQFFLFRFELIQAFFRGVRNNTHLDGVYVFDVMQVWQRRPGQQLKSPETQAQPPRQVALHRWFQA